MRVRNLAVCLVAPAMLLGTLPAMGAPSLESDCVTVTIYAMSSTGIVAPGNTVALAGKFINCSSQRVRFDYTLSAVSSCGQDVTLAAATKTLDPLLARIWSVSYTMPVDTCEGPWEATLTATSGGTVLSSASVIVTVKGASFDAPSGRKDLKPRAALGPQGGARRLAQAPVGAEPRGAARLS